MNKETYDALKIVVRMAYESGIQQGDDEKKKALEQVEQWMDETEKEYE